jgi:TolB-like protein
MAEQRVQRRLAAILAADVVGYSRLMGIDEVGTLSRLNDLRRELFDPTIASHSGRIVKLMGDGALVEFASVVDAVTCAVEIRRQAQDLANSSDENSIQFRMGINLGDVIIDGEDIYGDGVNIAARLQGVAESGGIVISEDAWRQVQGKVAAKFVDIGERSLKNIARPLRVYRVELDEDSATQPAALTFAPPDRPSIAVLPFQNMSGDPEQEYFADGVTEDTLTALSRFRELLVISRGSSFAFKDKSLDIREIAKNLSVLYVLSGSIRRAGDRVRVIAQLTNAETGLQVWADRYDRDLIDIFDLQDEISRVVAAVVHPAIRSAEIERARRKPHASLSAYDLYLRALPHLWAATRDELPKAIELLRRSLSLDPASTPTLAALAWCLGLGFWTGSETSRHTAADALDLARLAVERDRTDAFAQAVYGYALSAIAREYDQARLHAQEAIRLNPSSAFALGIRGMVACGDGDFELAVDNLRSAIGLSPFDTMLYMWMVSLSASYFGLERYEDGIIWARNAVQQNPSFGTAHRLLAANLALGGRVEEAREVTRKRDAVQKTTIRELRRLRGFRQNEVVERYLSAQRIAGIPE